MISDSAAESSPDNAPAGFAYGTLANASLPGAAFHPDEFDVEVSQTSLAEADELLKSMIDEAMRAVGGDRAFLALVDTQSGELALRFTAGDGWDEGIRALRLHMGQTLFENGANDASARLGITRYVVANGRRYWTGDTASDPYYIGYFPDTQSEVAVPVTARGGGTIGVVNVESTRAHAFDEEHANLLSGLARRIAIVIAMAEHQLREEALISVGKNFNAAADAATVMEDVVIQATKILRADDCSLFLMDENSEMLQLAASHGPLGKEAGRHESRYALGEGLTGWVAQNAEVIRVGDPRNDARWKGVFMEAPAGELAAVMAVPVRGHRGMMGVLRVVRHRKGSLYFLPQEFTQADEDVLVTLGAQLATAMELTQLMGRWLQAERMAAWGEMSARAAHMIGNAVFGIKGHLNELTYLTQQAGLGKKEDASTRSGAETVLRPELLQEVPQMLESVTRGIYRLEEILGEFRDFVLATQIHATPQDINHIMRAVTAESFPRNSNINLVLNLSPDLPLLHVDEAKLKRAFSELIENSIDFQPNGGQITIRTSLADAATVRDLAGREIAAPVVKAEFIDHGPGLSNSERQSAFQPFYTRKAKGMGLGLSIVKGIIEAHGGAIREIGDGGGEANLSLTAGRARGNTGAHFVILLPAGRDDANLPVEE